ncbi:uncharacterized protein LOC130591827 [Beta vulgaris subsp. vulgaris]|uniref:uncharacterized protein LOC130591827 n=1 Tax=Beta vulgaris subsp. vulgaris TaxID=3555 RepID=UPI0025487D4A|nr:uncharacterized protein LOC130591827 [Beta vulgaris subsp. vulgaris]
MVENYERCFRQPGFDWEMFLVKLRERFYPPAVQRKKESEFLFLRQQTMSVVEYAVKFMELSRFVPELVSTENFKMTRFFEGLNLRYQKLIGKYNSYQELYDLALEKERICQKEDEANKKRGGNKQGGNYDKRPRVEGWNNQVQMNRTRKPEKLEKCTRCGKMHAKSITCTGVPICYKCTKPGHLARDCTTNDGRVIQGNQGRFDNRQGGNTVGLNRYNNRGGNVGSSGRAAGKMYAMTEEEGATSGSVEVEGNVISGTFPVCYVPAYVLFDSGASKSFISNAFLKKLNPTPESVKIEFSIDIPDGTKVRCNKLYRDCLVNISGTELQADLIGFDLKPYDVILGMDWLSKHRALIECYEQKVKLKTLGGNKILYQEMVEKPHIKIVSAMKAIKSFGKGV